MLLKKKEEKKIQLFFWHTYEIFRSAWSIDIRHSMEHSKIEYAFHEGLVSVLFL